MSHDYISEGYLAMLASGACS